MASARCEDELLLKFFAPIASTILRLKRVANCPRRKAILDCQLFILG